MSIDRRTLLASFSALSLPAWLSAFAAEDPQSKSTPRSPRITPALENAKKTGRPLLVLIVPTDGNARSKRGVMWGLYLESAGEAAMADLALCEVVCAEHDQIEHELPDPAKAAWIDALAILVETDGSSPSVVGGPVPTLPAWNTGAEESVMIRRRLVDALQARLLTAIAPDRAVIERRARQNRASLTAGEAASLGSLSAPFAPTRRDADRVPACVRLVAENARDLRPACLALLEVQAVSRLRRAPPPGSRWARNRGCGSELEGPGPVWSPGPCGSGFAGPTSLRFLWMYTQSEMDQLLAENEERNRREAERNHRSRTK